MPPSIALLLCILFILSVLIIDLRRKSNVSTALWIPLIWMMIIGSKFVSQWLNPQATLVSPEDILEGSPIDRSVFIILIVAGLFTLSRREIYWSQILKSNKWVVIFFLYCGSSLLWSDFPFVSFKRFIKEIGNVVMVLIVLTEPDPFEAVKTLIRRCAYVLIPLSVLFIKYYRHLGVGYSPWGDGPFFLGVTTNKNTLARLCLVSGFYFFWNMVTMWHNKNISVDKKEIFVHILFLLMILWLLIKADSATSLASLIIGIFIVIGLGLPIISSNAKYIGIYLFLTALVFLMLQFLFDISQFFVLSLGRDMTLTDRILLWKELIDMGTNEFIGTGFESFWLGDRLAKLWSNHWWRPNEAHNGYLEIYLNLGWIGVILLIGVIFSFYNNIRRTLMFDFDYGRFRLAVLVMGLLYNVTEAAFIKGLHLMWFILLLIALECPRLSELQILENTGGRESTMDDT